MKSLTFELGLTCHRHFSFVGGTVLNSFVEEMEIHGNGITITIWYTSNPHGSSH